MMDARNPQVRRSQLTHRLSSTHSVSASLAVSRFQLIGCGGSAVRSPSRSSSSSMSRGTSWVAVRQRLEASVIVAIPSRALRCRRAPASWVDPTTRSTPTRYASVRAPCGGGSRAWPRTDGGCRPGSRAWLLRTVVHQPGSAVDRWSACPRHRDVAPARGGARLSRSRPGGRWSDRAMAPSARGITGPNDRPAGFSPV